MPCRLKEGLELTTRMAVRQARSRSDEGFVSKVDSPELRPVGGLGDSEDLFAAFHPTRPPRVMSCAAGAGAFLAVTELDFSRSLEGWLRNAGLMLTP